jgi:serine/threonine protein kinase/Tol biopolymer transport system component
MEMKTDKRWQQIEKLFHAALERRPPERDTFLAEACASDPDMLREVVSLIRAHEQEGSFIDSPAINQSESQPGLPPPAPLVGTRIGRYEIKELLGRGGMGEVYKATDTELGRTVAIKTLSPRLVGDQIARQRFLREARAASLLSHPSICTIYEVGQEGDLFFIAMQYLQGKTIASLISESPLAIEAALAFAIDGADALEEAHKNGIIHRDIKPSNILVNDRGVAVVLDFGLAKHIGPAGASDGEAATLIQATSAAALIGTPAYMSPEQIRGEALDARSDIFSFGVTLYEMLAGERPFGGQTQIDILHAILNKEPKPPSRIRPEIDKELDRIILKSLAKKSGERYASLEEMKADLLRLIQDKRYAVRGVTTASLAPGQSGSFGKSSHKLPMPTVSVRRGLSKILSPRVGLVLLLVAVTAAIAWWLALRPTPRTEGEASSARIVEVANWKSVAGEGYSEGALSPDGKFLAFHSTKDGTGNRSIWIKQMQAEAFKVTKDDWDNFSPVWSPDGQEIAYVSQRGAETGIWRMLAFQGAPTLIKKVEDGALMIKDWSRDGASIYYALRGNLFKLDLESGNIAQLTGFDSSKSPPSGFSVSPDETRIAYLDIVDEQSDVWIKPLEGGEPVRITDDAAEERNTVWHPDGKRVLYSSNIDGTFQIMMARLDGGKPAQLTFKESDSFVLDVSDDGTRILYGGSKEESDLWGVKINGAEEFEFTSDIGVELWSDVSPLGDAVAFQSVREMSQGNKISETSIQVKQTSKEIQSVQLATRAIDARWSPNGRMIAFSRYSGGKEDLWIISATGGGEKQLTNGGVYRSGYSMLPYNRAQVSDYDWSYDSKKIAYCSNDPRNIWTIAADGSGGAQITANTDPRLLLYCPLWSPDGKLIAYSSIYRASSASEKPLYGIWIVDAEKRTYQRILNSESYLRLLGWSESGSEIIFESIERHFGDALPRDIKLFQVSAGGDRRLLAELRATYAFNIRLSPDRRSVAFVSRQDGKDNVWVTALGGGAAKKVTSNNDARLFLSSITWSPDGKNIYFGKQNRFSMISMIEASKQSF